MKRAPLQGKQRPNGTWEVRVTLTTSTGAKKQQSCYGKTQQEAQEKAHRLIYETKRQAPEGILFSDLADRWKANLKVQPNTLRQYQWILDHIMPKLGKRRAEAVTVPDIMELVFLAGTDRKAQLIRAVCTMILNHGVLVGAIQQNPMTGIRSTRKYRPTRKRLTGQDLEGVLQKMEAEKGLFFRFLADTGLRPWKEAIDLPRTSLRYKADEWFVVVGQSKTDAGSGRVVPITDAHIAHMLADIEGDRLFPFSQTTYKRAWAAANPSCDIYALRRLAISRWCEEELPLDVIQRRAGHTDIKLTLNVYNSVRQERILTGQGVSERVRLSELMGEES